jgi:predicted nucleic acid-binding protein
MTAAELFFDTNLLLYVLSADATKADQAEAPTRTRTLR